MDFMADEYRERYGDDRPKPRVAEPVVARLQAAPSKLPPHDIWLQRIMGMENYGPRNDQWCAGGPRR
jgi:tryptophan halogenase